MSAPGGMKMLGGWGASWQLPWPPSNLTLCQASHGEGTAEPETVSGSAVKGLIIMDTDTLESLTGVRPERLSPSFLYP